MGCFSKNKQPQYSPPAPVTLPTAQELFGRATQFGQSTQPLAYGAREGALKDLSMGNAYYQQYQPLDFEQALADQYFANVWPDAERQIKHGLSLSGIESSPILAEQLGKARGQIGFDIGSYLSNQGNTRANYSLASRLGIDPYSTYDEYLNTDVNQSNAQAQLQQQYNEQRAMADYMTNMARYENQKAKMGTFATLGGGALGFMIGGPAGASIGAGLGGAASPLIGGGQSPIGMGDALSMYQMFGGMPKAGYGMNTPKGTMDMGSYSMLPKTVEPVWNASPGFGGGWYGWGG